MYMCMCILCPTIAKGFLINKRRKDFFSPCLQYENPLSLKLWCGASTAVLSGSFVYISFRIYPSIAGKALRRALGLTPTYLLGFLRAVSARVPQAVGTAWVRPLASLAGRRGSLALVALSLPARESGFFFFLFFFIRRSLHCSRSFSISTPSRLVGTPLSSSQLPSTILSPV